LARPISTKIRSQQSFFENEIGADVSDIITSRWALVSIDEKNVGVAVAFEVRGTIVDISDPEAVVIDCH
jgi:hypothetical protein